MNMTWKMAPKGSGMQRAGPPQAGRPPTGGAGAGVRLVVLVGGLQLGPPLQQGDGHVQRLRHVRAAAPRRRRARQQLVQKLCAACVQGGSELHHKFSLLCVVSRPPERHCRSILGPCKKAQNFTRCFVSMAIRGLYVTAGRFCPRGPCYQLLCQGDGSPLHRISPLPHHRWGAIDQAVCQWRNVPCGREDGGPTGA